jgi:hypothetical protein
MNDFRYDHLLPSGDKSVRLVYQDDFPMFQQGARSGTWLSIAFGAGDFEDNIGNLVDYIYFIRWAASGQFEIVRFSVSNSLLGYMTEAETKNEIARIHNAQDQKINELVIKVNLALSQLEEFDFSEYISLWEQFDPDNFLILAYQNRNFPDYALDM